MDDKASGFSPLQKEVIAGLSAGTLTTIVTHPLDLVKVRLQIEAISSKSSTYYRQIQNIVNVSKQRGIFQEVYRGLCINLVGNSVAWGLYFGLYRYSKDMIFELSSEANLKTRFHNDRQMHSSMYLLSALTSGLITSMLTNPIWVLKTRMMSTTSEKGYKSTTEAIARICREEGIGTFTKGLLPSLLGVSQGAIYFAIYDTLKLKYLHGTDAIEERKLSPLETISITSLSKMISVSSVYPLQLLKTNLQTFKAEHNENSGMLPLIRSIWNRNGIGGFYKGLSANLVRAVPSTCITFGIYEHFRHIL